MIDAVPAVLLDAYAAFRRARRPDDELTSTESRFPSLAEPAFGLNVALSRRIKAANGLDAVLVPGEGVVGVIEKVGGGVAGVHQLLDGSAVSTSFRGTGRLLVSGPLPDGVDEIRIVARSGYESRCVVQDHFYAVETVASEPGQLPAEIVFELAGDERRIAIPGADDEVMTMRGPTAPR